MQLSVQVSWFLAGWLLIHSTFCNQAYFSSDVMIVPSVCIHGFPCIGFFFLDLVDWGLLFQTFSVGIPPVLPPLFSLPSSPLPPPPPSPPTHPKKNLLCPLCLLFVLCYRSHIPAQQRNVPAPVPAGLIARSLPSSQHQREHVPHGASLQHRHHTHHVWHSQGPEQVSSRLRPFDVCWTRFKRSL